MDDYDIVAAIGAYEKIQKDKKIRKEKLLKLVKRFPEKYQISDFEEGWENLRVQHEKWRISIIVKESFNDDKLTAVEIQLQEFPCEYKAIEEFLSDMDYNCTNIKTYRSTTDVAADDILKKILTDFESFDKKFNQNPESEPEPEPDPVPPKFQLREKVSLRTSDDIQCIINGIKICEKFNYIYYVKICDYDFPLEPIEYVHPDDIWICECNLVKFKS